MTWASAVAHGRLADEREQQQGVGLGEQLLVQPAPDPPRLIVADIRRQLRHGFGVPVMDRHPQRADEIQVRGAAGAHLPFGGHHATLIQIRFTPSATACSLSGLATLWTVTMRPSASRSTVRVAMTRPAPLITMPGAAVDVDDFGCHVGDFDALVGTLARTGDPPATLSTPMIGRIAWRTLPPPSVHSVTSGASSSISSLMSPPVMAAKNRSVASRFLTRSVSNRGRRAWTCSRARCAA